MTRDLRQRVIIIDDDVNLTRIMKIGLEKRGYSVKTENDPMVAVKAVKEFKPDAIVLDVVMPEKDGGDLAQEIRDQPDIAGIPIIFCTSMLLKEEVRKTGGKIAGDVFMAKPVTIDEVVERIAQALTPARGAR